MIIFWRVLLITQVSQLRSSNKGSNSLNQPCKERPHSDKIACANKTIHPKEGLSMARILPEVGCKNPKIDSTVSRFFRRFELHRILNACGIRKKKGLSTWDIVLCLISMIFTNKSISAL